MFLFKDTFSTSVLKVTLMYYILLLYVINNVSTIR